MKNTRPRMFNPPESILRTAKNTHKHTQESEYYMYQVKLEKEKNTFIFLETLPCNGLKVFPNPCP